MKRGARSGKAGGWTRAVGLERGSTARSKQLSRQGKIDDEINQPPEIASCHIHAQPTPSTCLAPPLSLFEEPKSVAYPAGLVGVRGATRFWSNPSLWHNVRALHWRTKAHSERQRCRDGPGSMEQRDMEQEQRQGPITVCLDGVHHHLHFDVHTFTQDFSQTRWP